MIFVRHNRTCSSNMKAWLQGRVEERDWRQKYEGLATRSSGEERLAPINMEDDILQELSGRCFAELVEILIKDIPRSLIVSY